MRTKRQLQWGHINEHGKKLIALFGLPSDTDPHALYYALHRLEARAHSYAERACNEDLGDEAIEKHDASILRSVKALLGDKVPIMLNGDPRGYALKIPNDWMAKNNADLHKDWGGYGIICPDF